MLEFGNSMRRSAERAVRYSKIALMFGGKGACDVLLNKPLPFISFERLHDCRYYVYLLLALTRKGLVGCPARDAQLAWTLMPKRDFLRNVRLNWRVPSEGILLSERMHGPGIVNINRQYYSNRSGDGRLFAPYFAHPEFYKAGLHDSVFGMRGQERKVRVFFAGTVSNDKYAGKFCFPILSREKVLGHILDKFKLAINTSRGEERLKQLLILTTDDTRDTIDKHKLPMRDYISTMAKSDFFICPPGWLIPHSHNLIEAMSVGTIPITNYHKYMRPELAPDTNCLAFTTPDELQSVITRALQMAPGEIQRLREGVISYYDEYVDPTSFGTKLIKYSTSISEMVVNDESGR